MLLTHRDLSLDPGGRRVFRSGGEIALTKREFEILSILMREPGKLVTRWTISHTVWGRSAASAKNLLDVHMCSLRRKLGSGYVETVRGEGFRLLVEA
jgi:DNA-binding response OmpR family regulator